MNAKKVSIVTRARNRLEYTVQCVSAVRNNTHYPYEHLVINQASTDGTREWLDWIATMPSEWYSRVRAVHSPTNTGDWGGMLASLDLIADDSEYIVQLDNDIFVPKGWLKTMVAVLEGTDAAAVMLRRIGVGGTIKVSNDRVVYYDDADCHGSERYVVAGEVPKVVACYVCRRREFERVAPKLRGVGLLALKLDGPALKITSLSCEQMEGFRGKDLPYVQKVKYGVSEKLI